MFAVFLIERSVKHNFFVKCKLIKKKVSHK